MNLEEQIELEWNYREKVWCLEEPQTGIIRSMPKVLATIHEHFDGAEVWTVKTWINGDKWDVDINGMSEHGLDGLKDLVRQLVYIDILRSLSIPEDVMMRNQEMAMRLRELEGKETSCD